MGTVRLYVRYGRDDGWTFRLLKPWAGAGPFPVAVPRERLFLTLTVPATQTISCQLLFSMEAQWNSQENSVLCSLLGASVKEWK